jgi:hypothetical protein
MREVQRGNSENVSALSAGAYTTTWLVMVTLAAIHPSEVLHRVLTLLGISD